MAASLLYDSCYSYRENVKFVIVENLAPSELKKLRNKQRKARRKAELEKARAVAVSEKREQHKNRQADTETDAPPQDELVPDKLAKVDDPLDQAIKFLQPLQNLCSELLETHLMAYEIYSRKDKPLLMLQSVRRMFRLAPEHPEVHACVIRLSLQYREWLAQDRLPAPCRQVMAHGMEPITGDRSPATINQQFLQAHQNYLPAVFQGARMMYLLDPSSQATAIKLATNLDSSMSGVTIPVSIAVLNSLRKSEFGDCGEAASEYMSRCHLRFPLASAFNPSPAPTTPSPPQWGHVLESQENCLSN